MSHARHRIVRNPPSRSSGAPAVGPAPSESMRSIATGIGSSLSCAGCGRDDDATRGWRIYVTAWQPPATKTFCPECAERDLGEDER